LVEFAEMKPVVYVEEQTVGNFLEDAATYDCLQPVT
jgi:hypothetical protein